MVEQINDFMERMPDPTPVRQMSMDFDEFISAIAAVATLEPPRFPAEDFTKALERIVTKLLTAGPRKFL